MRLQKYLARSGLASRRKAERLIEAGRVTVDGVVATLGTRVRPGQEVRVDGRVVAPPAAVIVLLLHKPQGYTTTRSDPHALRTVYELLPELPGLHAVGRLDRDSEGLLLFTNHGELTQRLTHPRYRVARVYRVWTKKGAIPPPVARQLVRGVRVDGERLKAQKARPAPGGAVLTLTEGKKREVRRMLAALGYPVVRLLRVKMGPVRLGGLKAGQWRRLDEAEVDALFRSVGLEKR